MNAPCVLPHACQAEVIPRAADDSPLQDAFQLSLQQMLDAFGERVAVFIGGPQFASWQRQASDEEGTIDGVKQSVMEVTRNLPEDVVQIDLYQSLLARLLEDMRNLIRADDLLPEDDDDDWLQERTFALDLKANAETGILRGLEKGETN